MSKTREFYKDWRGEWLRKQLGREHKDYFEEQF